MNLGADPDHVGMTPSWLICPECSHHVLSINFVLQYVANREGGVAVREERAIVWPRVSSRPPPPTEVPNPFAQDYREASLVLADSPKASAALSRRCLQSILRDQAGVKPSNLSNEIDEAMPSLPPYLADAIDAVRNVGNFAAHPMKSKSSGEVVDVEPGEAEWLLDVLEGLFSFYFVGPAELEQKRGRLDEKLDDLGKPPLKAQTTGDSTA